jgi:hypothetical protein
MNLASELEMRPLLAHCHFGYGEMGTTYWLEKLEKGV